MRNIWALQKDESIKLLLLLLHEKLGPDGYEIAENQQLDVKAIRLYKTNEQAVSAYIYTYGQAEERYGVHLELPAHDDMDVSNTMEIFECLNLSRLMDMLCVHFDLVPVMADSNE